MQMTKVKKERTSTYLPMVLMRKVRIFAAKNGMRVSAVLEAALTKYLTEHK